MLGERWLNERTWTRGEEAIGVPAGVELPTDQSLAGMLATCAGRSGWGTTSPSNTPLLDGN